MSQLPNPPIFLPLHRCVRHGNIIACERRSYEPAFAKLFGYTPEEWEMVKAHRQRTIYPCILKWNDGVVVKIAKNISLDGAFDNLSILADALEEGGCTDTDLLNHCRQRGEHLLRCWVIETMLNQAPELRPQLPVGINGEAHPAVETDGDHLFPALYNRLTREEKPEVDREMANMIAHADALPVSCRPIYLSPGRYWFPFPDGRRMLVRFRKPSPREEAPLVTPASAVGHLLPSPPKIRQHEHASSPLKKRRHGRQPYADDEDGYPFSKNGMRKSRKGK